mgnify:CR=1 FL=1
MKKRLISLLLAFSMMLTFLPAGAVSAFAEEPVDSSKGTLLHGGENITDSGTYQLRGPYTQGITINTTGTVVINVTGNVTGELPHIEWGTVIPLISIQAGTVNFNGDSRYTVTNNQVICNDGGNLTVNGGKYVCKKHPYERDALCFSLGRGRNLIENVTIETDCGAISLGSNGENAVIKSSKITAKWAARDGAIFCRPNDKMAVMELDDVEVEAEEGDALLVETGTVTVNGGNYKSGQGCAIGTRANSDVDLDLTINGGTYQGYNYDWTVADFGCHGHPRDPRECNIHIYGSTFVGGRLLRFYGDYAKTLTIDDDTTFESTGSTFDAVVVGDGQLIFNSGTIEVSGDSERSALRTFEKGEAIVNGGTFKGAKYDIYERNDDYRVSADRVHLKNATFDDSVCNVYLDEDLQIDVAQNYTGEVTIECKDPSDGRQLTKATETNYQKDLNLTSANAGYLVGYKKTTNGKEYRCLSKTVGVTISDLKSEIKAEDSAEFTVTLTYKDSTGTGILTFGDKNSEIEYKDENDKFVPMPKDGLPIDKNDYAFRITPKNAGEQKLTAAVVRDAVEVGKDSETYHVAGRVHTTVTIEGLEDAVIKEGESKDFTVKVAPKDDAKLGEAVIDFGDKNSEIEYQDKNGEYKLMPDGGRKIDLGDGEKPYAFRITPKETGKQTLTAAVVRDAVELGTAEKEYTVAGRVHTTVAIEGLENAVIKEGESEDFTVKVTPNDDAKLGEAFIDFGDKNGEIEYKDEHGAYQPMPEGGLKIGLGDGEVKHEFRITPKDAGDQKLTAAVVRDDVELGTAEKNFTVAGRVHTTVTIEGLENAVIKEGESKDFTVKVDPKDDANLGKAFIDFGDKNSEIEYKDKNGEYKPMPEGGLPIDLSKVKEQYTFRIAPKETGKQTLTAAVK